MVIANVLRSVALAGAGLCLAAQWSAGALAAPEGEAQTYFSNSPQAMTLFYPNLG